jgi:DNA-binding PadR family transcriptional regulator
MFPIVLTADLNYDVVQMASDALGEFEQMILLAIVHLGDDAYGAAIRREIESRTGREVAVGALYTTLERLERKGFVASQMSPPTAHRGGRARRQFEMRPAGAAALKRSRDTLARMWSGLSPDLRRTR